ncbi:MAG TPA: isochorismatase family protein [Actinomycetes bacterium]|nr:isochorismatase family protein [Actinomycetes bacterium]
MSDTTPTPAIWAGAVDPADQAQYEKIGFGVKGGLGRRPAAIVIDVQQRTVNERYAASCGEAGRNAVPKIARVLDTARSVGAPVFFAYVAPTDSNDSSRFAVKMPVLQSVDQAGYDFLDEVSPQPGDILLPKRHPSAFFGTPLVSYLVDRGIDSLIVTGATTSGCIRATVIDAFSYGYKVAVPHDAVFDRVKTSHQVNLFDINYKYGDVVGSNELVDQLRALDAAPAEA